MVVQVALFRLKSGDLSLDVELAVCEHSPRKLIGKVELKELIKLLLLLPDLVAQHRKAILSGPTLVTLLRLQDFKSFPQVLGVVDQAFEPFPCEGIGPVASNAGHVTHGYNLAAAVAQIVLMLLSHDLTSHAVPALGAAQAAL